MKKAINFWYARGNECPCRVTVCPAIQQRPHGLPPVTVYRTLDKGFTFPSRYLHSWGELRAEQKKAVYRDYYRRALDDARWRIAKDPALAGQFKEWRNQTRKERDAAIAKLDAGEQVAPPNLFV